jgi:hypothetical protein
VKQALSVDAMLIKDSPCHGIHISQQGVQQMVRLDRFSAETSCFMPSEEQHAPSRFRRALEEKGDIHYKQTRRLIVTFRTRSIVRKRT